MASIEDLLMYKIQDDSASVPSQQTAMLGGAALGAVPGLAAGVLANEAGNNVNKLLNRNPRPFAPGFRLAGGLVGAILFGGFGTLAAVVIWWKFFPALSNVKSFSEVRPPPS